MKPPELVHLIHHVSNHLYGVNKLNLIHLHQGTQLFIFFCPIHVHLILCAFVFFSHYAAANFWVENFILILPINLYFWELVDHFYNQTTFYLFHYMLNFSLFLKKKNYFPHHLNGWELSAGLGNFLDVRSVVTHCCSFQGIFVHLICNYA